VGEKLLSFSVDEKRPKLDFWVFMKQVLVIDIIELSTHKFSGLAYI